VFSKQCSDKTKAMLQQNESYAPANQKLCSGKTKAMLKQDKSNLLFLKM
jgi:hypothetical protein